MTEKRVVKKAKYSWNSVSKQCGRAGLAQSCVSQLFISCVLYTGDCVRLAPAFAVRSCTVNYLQWLSFPSFIVVILITVNLLTHSLFLIMYY
jgi:hypothetical protein